MAPRRGASTADAGYIPSVCDVVIEVPQFSFVKRKGDGSIDYIAPLPSPFPGYGSVPGSLAEDGAPPVSLRLCIGGKIPETVRRMQETASL